MRHFWLYHRCLMVQGSIRGGLANLNARPIFPVRQCMARPLPL